MIEAGGGDAGGRGVARHSASPRPTTTDGAGSWLKRWNPITSCCGGERCACRVARRGRRLLLPFRLSYAAAADRKYHPQPPAAVVAVVVTGSTISSSSSSRRAPSSSSCASSSAAVWCSRLATTLCPIFFACPRRCHLQHHLAPSRPRPHVLKRRLNVVQRQHPSERHLQAPLRRQPPDLRRDGGHSTAYHVLLARKADTRRAHMFPQPTPGVRDGALRGSEGAPGQGRPHRRSSPPRRKRRRGWRGATAGGP